jgi:tight adherence protein B
MTTLLAALAVGGGLATLVIAVLLRAREREAEIASILDLPFGEKDVKVEESAQGVVAFLEPGVAFANRALERFDLMTRVTEGLVRARIPLRPGEFVLVAGGTSVIGSIATWLLTGQPLVGLIALVALLYGSWFIVKMRAGRRSKAFEAQLPEALSLIASSLEAGHTFLHSISMMVEESEPPLSEEFERVIAETRLGDPLIDALQRMSERLQISDLAWVVQAIRIQQTVGGKLADLLNTLAEFMRAREEIRREVQVLTAEGRLSAWVLGALPVFVFMVVKTLNPKYLNPMLHGKGLIALFIAAGSVLTGMAVIKRMAKIDV